MNIMRSLDVDLKVRIFANLSLSLEFSADGKKVLVQNEIGNKLPNFQRNSVASYSENSSLKQKQITTSSTFSGNASCSQQISPPAASINRSVSEIQDLAGRRQPSVLHKRNLSNSSFSQPAVSPVGGVPLPGFIVAESAMQKQSAPKHKKDRISETFSFTRSKSVSTKKKHERSLSSSSQQSDIVDGEGVHTGEQVASTSSSHDSKIKRHLSLKSTDRSNKATNIGDRLSFPNLHTMWRTPTITTGVSVCEDEVNRNKSVLLGKESQMPLCDDRPSTSEGSFTPRNSASRNSYKSAIQDSVVCESPILARRDSSSKILASASGGPELGKTVENELPGTSTSP